VGLLETERESETVELGDCDGVGELVAVALAVGVGLGDCVIVVDGDAPIGNEDVGEADSEAELRDAVEDGDDDGEGDGTPGSAGDDIGKLVVGARVCVASGVGANEKLPLVAAACDG